MKRSLNGEELLWVSSAVTAHRASLRGERLISLRTRVSEAKRTAFFNLCSLAGGIACGFLLYIKPHQILTMGQAGELIFIFLFMGALVACLYSPFFLIGSLNTLYRHAGIVSKHEGQNRLPDEEHEANNALGHLAMIAHENALFVQLCRWRWEVYESLRDSGQIDPHPGGDEIEALLEQAEHEISEELNAVNGLLLRHKYMDKSELELTIERILWRPNLFAIGKRLSRMAALDLDTFHQKIVKVNSYKIEEDPRIGELGHLLETRLAA